MGPYPPKVELVQQTSPSQSEIGRSVALGFPHRAGRYQPNDIRVRPRVVGVVDVCGWIPIPRCDPMVSA